MRHFEKHSIFSFKHLFIIALILFSTKNTWAEDGYRLWLRYDKISNEKILNNYKTAITELVVFGTSPVIASAKKELKQGLNGLLNQQMAESGAITRNGALVIGTLQSSPVLASLNLKLQLEEVGKEGFVIQTVKINQKMRLSS
jgi:alpha-glucuronidase